jgi:hypothetical protein
MELDIGSATVRAAQAAREALATTAPRLDERAMSVVARRALFDEALLGAIKARVAELKTVAK